MCRIRFLSCFFSVILSGCFANDSRESSFFNQADYPHRDSASLRTDLDQTLQFLPTIGLKRLEEPKDNPGATEAVFIRDMGDHFHVTVTVRGLAQLDGDAWIMTVRVDSYNIGEEGAVAAGQSLLKEIDDWHRYEMAKTRPSITPLAPSNNLSPVAQ